MRVVSWNVAAVNNNPFEHLDRGLPGFAGSQRNRPVKRQKGNFPRMSSPFSFLLLFWSSLCVPLTRQKYVFLLVGS